MGSPRGNTAAENPRPPGAHFLLRSGLRPRRLRSSSRCSLPFDKGSRIGFPKLPSVTVVTLVTVVWVYSHLSVTSVTAVTVGAKSDCQSGHPFSNRVLYLTVTSARWAQYSEMRFLKSGGSYSITGFAVLPEPHSCLSVSPASLRSLPWQEGHGKVISHSDGHSIVKEQKKSRCIETPEGETTTSL